MKTHVMIDLETMGLGTRPALLQIGAAVAEGGVVLPTGFSQRVDLGSCLVAGLTTDASTIAWWARQSDEARASVFRGPSRPLSEALDNFDAWVDGLRRGDAPLIVWSHGAATDLPWLASAYAALGREPPWTHREPRDTRTLYDAASSVGWSLEESRVEPAVAHDATYDAIAQLRTVLSAEAHLVAVYASKTQD